jgi:hypothetical protein
VRFEGQSYRHFSSVQATTISVLGEFYWEVAAGEGWYTDDYVAPPLGLSREKNREEVAWSAASYLEPSEVEKAFGLTGLEAERTGVGAMQPWPHLAAERSMLWWAGAATLLAVVYSVAVGPEPVTLTRLELPPISTPMAFQDGWAEWVPPALPADGGAEPVFAPPPKPDQPVELAGTSEAPSSHSFLSLPFDVPADRNLELRLQASVDNSWAWAAGAIIQKDTGESDAFEAEPSYYHGYDSDGSWSEGSTVSADHLSALPAGRYVLRFDYEWEANRPRPAATLTVTAGVARGWRLALLLAALWLFPSLLLIARASFTNRRWAESNLT